MRKWPPPRPEQIEKLEQLRVLEAGYEILVGVVDEPTFGIDTPDDYRAFVLKMRNSPIGEGRSRRPYRVLNIGDFKAFFTASA